MGKKRGRPLNDDDFFAMEMHRVMRVFGCGWRAACRRISRGDKVPDKEPVVKQWSLDPATKLPRCRPVKTEGSQWQGQKVRTLETRYQRWLAREKDRQKTYRQNS
jgi:hypothetical protein